MGGAQTRIGPSPYDTIAELYDPWSRSVKEDVGFYVKEARASSGPVVELGIGTGRIAIPVAWAGIRVIGVDSSREMLATCARAAEKAAVSELLDLRLGDLRHPPVEERVSLVICPFRAYLHMADDAERVEALEAARELLLPGGTPDLRRLRAHGGRHRGHARPLARARARDLRAGGLGHGHAHARALGPRTQGEATMTLSWTSHDEWQRLLEETGFEVEAATAGSTAARTATART